MKIYKTFEEPKSDHKRVGVILHVELSPMVRARVRDLIVVRTNTPIPMPLYQHPDGTITLATDRKAEGFSKPYEAFRLRTARVRSWSKGCSLQVATGKVHLGYINPADRKVADEWLTKVAKEAENLIDDAVKKILEKPELPSLPTTTEVMVERETAGVDYIADEAERTFR